jgi:hypothetical protein
VDGREPVTVGVELGAAAPRLRLAARRERDVDPALPAPFAVPFGFAVAENEQAAHGGK